MSLPNHEFLASWIIRDYHLAYELWKCQVSNSNLSIIKLIWIILCLSHDSTFIKFSKQIDWIQTIHPKKQITTPKRSLSSWSYTSIVKKRNFNTQVVRITNTWRLMFWLSRKISLTQLGNQDIIKNHKMKKHPLTKIPIQFFSYLAMLRNSTTLTIFWSFSGKILLISFDITNIKWSIK